MANTHRQTVSCVNVHILTENRLLRETLARLLVKRSGMCVVDISESIDGAAKEIASSQCQVVLTDCLSAAHGSELLRKICGQDPPVKVVLFGMEEDPESFLKSVYLGVSGYVLKDASATEIIAALKAVAEGEAVCPPRLCMSLIQHLSQRSRIWPKGADHEGVKQVLTHRQLELLGLVAQGLTNKEIANNLNLSEFTVKNHMRRIMRQVDAEDRFEAVDAIRAIGGFLPNA
jgi:two-component system, NarL family, response regulator DegU